VKGGSVRIARIYDHTTCAEGKRVLVDRVWPRGVRKDDARLDAWVKDVAPSTGLRKWFGHDPAKFTEFRARYERELADEPGRTALRELRELAGKSALTLLTATRDLDHSHVAVLADLVVGGT
jgi:uncharacterized protein YeaO (DUF488 family)